MPIYVAREVETQTAFAWNNTVSPPQADNYWVVRTAGTSLPQTGVPYSQTERAPVDGVTRPTYQIEDYPTDCELLVIGDGSTLDMPLVFPKRVKRLHVRGLRFVLDPSKAYQTANTDGSGTHTVGRNKTPFHCEFTHSLTIEGCSVEFSGIAMDFVQLMNAQGHATDKATRDVFLLNNYVAHWGGVPPGFHGDFFHNGNNFCRDLFIENCFTAGSYNDLTMYVWEGMNTCRNVTINSTSFTDGGDNLDGRDYTGNFAISSDNPPSLSDVYHGWGVFKDNANGGVNKTHPGLRNSSPGVQGDTAPDSMLGASYVSPFDIGQEGEPATGGRDPYLWPGAVSSPYNTPIGTGATYSGESDAKTTTLKSINSLAMNTTSWGQPVAQSEPTQSRVVTITTSQSGGPLTIPLPNDAAPSAGVQEPGNLPDAALTIVTHPSQAKNNDGRQIAYHLYETQQVNNTYWTATLIRACDVAGNLTAYDALDPQTWQPTSTNYAGIRATGLTGIGGLIRGWEINGENPEIRHALSFGAAHVLFSQTEIVWPAARKDGTSSINQGNLAYGQHLAIPQSVDIEALGLNKQAKAVAYALQRFGVFLTDRTQNTANRFIIHSEPTVSDTAKNAILSTSNGLRANNYAVIRMLRVVTNSNQSTPGGPGSRIFATAPAIGAATTQPPSSTIVPTGNAAAYSYTSSPVITGNLLRREEQCLNPAWAVTDDVPDGISRAPQYVAGAANGRGSLFSFANAGAASFWGINLKNGPLNGEGSPDQYALPSGTSRVLTYSVFASVPSGAAAGRFRFISGTDVSAWAYSPWFTPTATRQNYKFGFSIPDAASTVTYWIEFETGNTAVQFVLDTAVMRTDPSTPAPSSAWTNRSGAWSLIKDFSFGGSALNTNDWTPGWVDPTWSTNDGNTHVYSDNAIEVSGGTLKLRSNLVGGEWQSGFVHSGGKFDFQYGLVEVRFRRIGSTTGGFPAIWFMRSEPPKYTVKGSTWWPRNGEFDLWEGPIDPNDPTGVSQDLSYSTMHWFNEGDDGNKKRAYSLELRPFDGFNTLSWMWEPDKAGRLVMTALLNGAPYAQWLDGEWDQITGATSFAPYDQPFQILLNCVADANTWYGGSARADSSGTGIEISHVRVFQRSTS